MRVSEGWGEARQGRALSRLGSQANMSKNWCKMRNASSVGTFFDVGSWYAAKPNQQERRAKQ